MTTKHLRLSGWILQVAFWALLFLGLDSEKRPTTVPFLVAAMVCAIASLVIWALQFRRAAQERRRTDV